ncbi:hypothetical protein [Parvularcula sp. LCG005]|uniref:hypothetical protein n=1 Tax=Parvularcula sp. LCG005 TaxID=3078805 RepID=UPI00294260A6|nr:hypothetical protein [Parvularcula sp. LCG005]WOI54285.1 hypothetical protein RUI03_04615 [Parvularcula sp. LCG005]
MMDLKDHLTQLREKRDLLDAEITQIVQKAMSDATRDDLTRLSALSLADMVLAQQKLIETMIQASDGRCYHPTFFGMPIDEAAQLVLSARHQRRGPIIPGQ